MFELPKLNYNYDALEPGFDARTVEIHYTKHHNAYLTNFKKALIDEGVGEEIKIEDIFKDIGKYSDFLRNNAGGYFNHNIFWESISPEKTPPNEKLQLAIDNNFDNIENLKILFKNEAVTIFGSGWLWLIKQGDKLKLVKTKNQDNPLMNILNDEDRGEILLGLDMWEHAFYLKYQNRKDEYIDAFWEIINWDRVNKSF